MWNKSSRLGRLKLRHRVLCRLPKVRVRILPMTFIRPFALFCFSFLSFPHRQLRPMGIMSEEEKDSRNFVVPSLTLNSLNSVTMTSRKYQTDGESACINVNSATDYPRPTSGRHQTFTWYDNVSPRSGGFYLPGPPCFPTACKLKRLHQTPRSLSVYYMRLNEYVETLPLLYVFGLETIARDAGRSFDLCVPLLCGDVKWPKYFQTFLAPATIICLFGYLSNISLNLLTTFKTKNPWSFKKRKKLILCSKKLCITPFFDWILLSCLIYNLL